MVLTQPLRRKCPRIEDLVEAFDHKRLPANDDMQQDQLFELVHALRLYHIAMYPVDECEIGRVLHQRANIEVRRERLERSPGAVGWHRDDGFVCAIVCAQVLE